MKKYYLLAENDPFIIYGASFLGKQIYQNLIRCHRKVEAFFDQAAETMVSIGEVPVLLPNADIEKKEKYIVIIAVTNRYEHSIIANYLASLGYKKILFKSGEGQETNENEELYNAILNGEELEGKKGIFYEKAKNEIEEIVKNKIEEIADKIEDTFYRVEVPVELLFYREKDGTKKSVYEENSILLYYQFLDGKEEALVSLLKNLKQEEEDFSRWMEVERMNYLYLSEAWQSKNGMDQKELPLIQREERGCFFIQSHIREILFYISKGYRRIFCKLQKKDLFDWEQEERIKQCSQLIKEQRISFVYTPILHPVFYYFPCKRENCGQTRLMKICQYFTENNILVEGKKILDAGTYIGYFAQHMYRMGAEVTAVEFDRKNYELLVNINKLIGCEGIETQNIGIQDMEEKKNYDITFLLTVLYWHLDTEIGVQLIKKIDKLTKEVLIWESGNEPEREKEFILKNTAFYSYKKIASTFGSGKLREMGVFYKKKK